MSLSDQNNMIKGNSPRHQPLIIFICFLTVFVIAYAPAITENYAHHDDYLFAVKRQNGYHILHEMLWALGRIVGDWILHISQYIIYDYSDFKLLRFLNVFFLSICATTLYYWIRPYFVRPLDVFLFISIIFTSIPVLSATQWACTLYMFAALFFAMMAASQAVKALDLNGSYRIKYSFYSIVFFLLSLLTYQTLAMYYWVMLAFRFLFETHHDLKRFWRRVFFVSAIAACAMIIYLIILKTICKPYSQYLDGIYNPYTWTIDYWKKLEWFLREPLFNAINFWTIFPKQQTVVITLLFFTLAGIIAFCRTLKDRCNFPKNLWFGISATIVLIAAFLLAYLPNLLNQAPAPFYRTCIGLSTLFLFLWLWTIRQLLSTVPAKIRASTLSLILFLVFNWSLFQCFKHVFLYRVIPSQMEWNYTVNIFSNNDLKNFNRIVVITPLKANLDRYDEFGAFTTYFNDDATRLVPFAFAESGNHRNGQYIKRFTTCSSDNIPDLNDATLVVDMRQPQATYWRLMSIIDPQ